MENKTRIGKDQHIATQKEDGSIFCYCPNLPNKTISVSVSHTKKSLICSVCGEKVNYKGEE